MLNIVPKLLFKIKLKDQTGVTQYIELFIEGPLPEIWPMAQMRTWRETIINRCTDQTTDRPTIGQDEDEGMQSPHWLCTYVSCRRAPRRRCTLMAGLQWCIVATLLVWLAIHTYWHTESAIQRERKRDGMAGGPDECRGVVLYPLRLRAVQQSPMCGMRWNVHQAKSRCPFSCCRSVYRVEMGNRNKWAYGLWIGIDGRDSTECAGRFYLGFAVDFWYLNRT